MSKYFFLDQDKKWRGPYWGIGIIFLALTGKIQPGDYLWNTKLRGETADHPSVSVFSRRRAYTYPFLRWWLFKSNLAVLGKAAYESIKRWRLKQNAVQRFMKTPIETTPSMLKKGTKIYLMPSITAANDFTAPGNFMLKLIYVGRGEDAPVQVSEYPIVLRMDDKPGISFEITMADPPEVAGVLHKESYGLHRRLGLKGRVENIGVERDSVFDFSTRFPFKPQVLKGRLRQANVITAKNYKDGFNRLMIKVEDDQAVSPLDIVNYGEWHEFDHEQFNVHRSLMGLLFRTGSGSVQVKFDGNSYRFYMVEGDILFIDGLGREDLELFKQKTEVMRIALALLSGKFYGGVCRYLTAEDVDFRLVEGVWYEVEKASVLSKRRVLDLDLFRSSFGSDKAKYESEYKPYDSRLKPELFSALCEALWSQESLRHAANLVVSAMGHTDPLQQGALYSVALEAITNTLSEAKSGGLKPIPDKPTSRKFIAELMSVLTYYEAQVPKEGMNILKKNIEGINKPTNRDKLVQTFRLYGLELSQEDVDAIDKRNEYLHGRNPLSSGQHFELTQISLRLHTLILSLLLKSCGYSGHVINLDIEVIITNEEKMSELSEEMNARFVSLVQQLEDARTAKDQAKFNAVKAEFKKHLDENVLRQLIRMI